MQEAGAARGLCDRGCGPLLRCLRMGQRGLCVRGGVAGVIELWPPVEVIFSGDEDSSQCVVHGGLGRSSMPVACPQAVNQPQGRTGVEVMGRDTREESESQARRRRPRQDHSPSTASGLWSRGHRPAVSALGSEKWDQEKGGVWGKCSEGFH